MKIKNTMAALLVGTGLALGVPSSQAALVNDWVSGDFLVGFRASGGQGSSVSYLINIGQASQFTSSTSAFNLNVGNIGLDLAAQFGSNWFERTDLFWGIAGTTQSVAPTLYASRARSNPGTQSTPWPALTNAVVRNGIQTEISAVAANGSFGFNTLQATANSPNAAVQPNALAQYSWNYQVTAFPTDFGTTSQWTNIEGSFGAASSKALDVYSFNNSGVTYRGVFSIDDQGQIAFNTIPEPSTYALMALAGTIFVIALRRRRAPANL